MKEHAQILLAVATVALLLLQIIANLVWWLH